MAVSASQIQQLYIAYYGRPADPAGLAYWQAQAAAGTARGTTDAAILDSFGASFGSNAEYTATFANMSDVQKVNTVYNNLFSHDADPAGLLYWATKLTNGDLTIANIVRAVSTSATTAANVDGTAFNSKVTAAESFTGALTSTAQILGYTGTAAGVAAKAWITTINSAATLATAIAAPALAATVAVVAAPAVVAGQTFTLTTGIDSMTGNSSDDTFFAVSAASIAATTDTLTVTDTIAGGAGTDTLRITFSATNTDVTDGAMISSIETVQIRGAVATATVGTYAAGTGVTTIAAYLSTGDVTSTALAAGGAYGVVGDGSIANGILLAGYAAAATAGTLNISGGTTAGAVTLSGTGLTSQTVNSTGATNVIGALFLAATETSLTVNATTKLTTGALTNTGGGAALATITVTGAGAVSFGATALEAGVATINAATNTGGLTVALGSLVTQAVTGSSSNDVITTGGVFSTGSANAGDGGDTLVAATMAHINTLALGAKYTNFETLRLTHATANTLDLAATLTGITAIQLAGDATLTGLTATQAANITIRSNAADGTADDMSFALASASGTADVLTIVAGLGTTTTSASDIAALVVTGFETLNLQALAGPTSTAGAGGALDRTTHITGTITGATLANINLTGTAVSITNIGVTKALAINGSALTGDGATTPIGLTVAGSAVAGSVITGSGVKDVMTIDAEGSTYNGGAGNDTITTTVAILAADGVTDLVINGGLGTDVLTLTGALTMTDNHLTNVSGMETLTTAATTTVSYTGFGAAAKVAFADGLTITSGTLDNDAAYTVGTGLYDKNVKVTLVSSGDGATTADNIAITTGAGADTVTVTAASWVGAAGAAGLFTISTGAGIDTITVSVGTLVKVTGNAPVSITAGTGADVINVTSVEADTAALSTTYVIAAGDSTISAYDVITGFDLVGTNLQSQTLDFASVTLTAYTAAAATGFASSELTVAVSATGVVTFAGTSAAAATLAQKIAAVQSVVITNAGDSAMFTANSNTYVFNNNATADSLVELVGVTGTGLITTNGDTASTFAGAIFIA